MGRARGMPVGDCFLIVVGISPEDCKERLAYAMTAYGRHDLEAIVSIWLEEWKTERWLGLEILSLRKLKLKRNVYGNRTTTTG